ncbi:MAG: four helix bundle protein [Patescibacteria group bacterium]
MTEIDKKFRFRKFPVYIESRKFLFEIKKLAREKFPKYELFSLTNQLSRAADSIILNIAEGSDRSSDKDFAHFLNLSHTSLNEVVACVDIALDNKYISEDEHLVYLNKGAELANQLTAFRNSLLKTPTK